MPPVDDYRRALRWLLYLLRNKQYEVIDSLASTVRHTVPHGYYFLFNKLLLAA